MTQTKERKHFKDLNLLDRFLFAEAMEDQQNMELLLDIILNQETHLKHPTQTEKELRRTNEDRQVRLDVYVLNEELIEVLKYIEKTTDETAEHCNSEKVQKLHQKICQLKANKQVEAKFMQAWEEKVLERQEAYAEGAEQVSDLYGKLMELIVWKI